MAGAPTEKGGAAPAMPATPDGPRHALPGAPNAAQPAPHNATQTAPPDAAPPDAHHPAVPAPSARRPWWWRLLKLAAVVAAAGVAVWAVEGKSDELSGATSYFHHLDWGWIAAGVVVEGLSYIAFANLQRRLLHAGEVEAGLRSMTGITLAGNAIQNSLPAGVVISAAFAFRQYRRFGADDVLSSWVIVAMTILSLMSLSGLAAVGLAMAASDGSGLDLAEVILGTLGVMGLLWVVWRRREWLISHSVGAVRLSQRLVHRPDGDAAQLVTEVRERLGAISPSKADWAVAAAMAAANWVFDMVCLAAAFLSVHAAVPWRGLLLAYAAAQLASNLPITPGGLGVVEGSLTIALVAFGGAETSTVAAVVIYRLLGFWLMLPLGWGSWGVLSYQGRRRASARRSVAVASSPRLRRTLAASVEQA